MREKRLPKEMVCSYIATKLRAENMHISALVACPYGKDQECTKRAIRRNGYRIKEYQGTCVLDNRKHK